MAVETDTHECTAPGCGRSFGTARGLNRHTTAMHSNGNGRPHVDPEELLGYLFPEGVPADKVETAARWMEDTRDLVEA